MAPVEIGEGDRVMSEDPNEIALGFVGLYAAKSGKLDTKALAASTNIKATQTKNLLILKQIALGARMVAMETDGTFPGDLGTILEAGVLRDDRTKVVDPATGEAKGPLFFRGVREDSPAKMMILACPFTNPDGTRTVAFADGSLEHIPEDEYQAKAAGQK